MTTFVLAAFAAAGAAKFGLWGDTNVPLLAIPGRPSTHAGPASDIAGQQAVPDAARKALGFPTPGYEAAATPLGVPRQAATSSSSFAFLKTQPDGITPVTWDPCRPIHYVTSATGAPAGGDQMVADAVAAVHAATGLVFINDGATDEVDNAAAPRPLSLPDRYGDRWSPVLISWATPQTNTRLVGGTAGYGGPVSVSVDGAHLVNVTGVVSLDAPQIAELEQLEGNGSSVVKHELGHLVGLAHVDDPTQLMNPVGTEGVTTFAAGDLTGLAALGTGACEPRL
ncbi:matrixin [Cellulomonas sp. PhB150]|nr:matrixin [Cellulomonas sp. PhB150]